MSTPSSSLRRPCGGIWAEGWGRGCWREFRRWVALSHRQQQPGWCQEAKGGEAPKSGLRTDHSMTHLLPAVLNLMLPLCQPLGLGPVGTPP